MPSILELEIIRWCLTHFPCSQAVVCCDDGDTFPHLWNVWAKYMFHREFIRICTFLLQQQLPVTRTCLPAFHDCTEKKHDDTCCKIKAMKNTPLLSPRLPLSTFSPQQRHQWRNLAAAAATAGTEAAHYLHAPRGNPMHEPSRGVTAWRRVQACVAYILGFKNVWHSLHSRWIFRTLVSRHRCRRRRRREARVRQGLISIWDYGDLLWTFIF